MPSMIRDFFPAGACTSILILSLTACDSSDTTVNTFPDPDSPRVVSALSTGNTSVLVTFSRPVVGGMNGAENPEHYRIVENLPDNSNAGAVVLVQSAALAASGTTVQLTTLSQSDLEYRLTVSQVTDIAGRPLASGLGGDNPSSAVFAGTPPGMNSPDSDNDGLSDAAEQRGWPIVIVLASGRESDIYVTSDPFIPDTDADGIGDAAERDFGTNPRASDTDGDELTDYAELTDIYSSPVHQDSDGDTLQDGLEFDFFRTSPILDDTDGDQLLDFDEVIAGNRDPLMSDLPRPRIRVGNVDLQLDVRFAYTDETGTSNTTVENVATTLAQSEIETFRTSDENSTRSTLETSSTLEAEVSFPKGGGVKSSLGITAGLERGHTSTFGTESSTAAEEVYEESLTTEATVDRSKSVTRTIEGGSIKTDITIENTSDIPFTISNLELTAQTQDPRDRRRLVPVGSLVPENPSFESVNIGALGDVGRGPFVFSAGQDAVFPQQIENLLKSPRGLVVKLANFDITDEAGRNFVFASQEVLDRTVGINIDYGDGRVETYRVATASTHDSQGRPRGITLEYALDGIIGLSRYPTINDGGNGVVDTTAVGDDEQFAEPGEYVEPGGRIIGAGANGILDTSPEHDDIETQPGYATTAVMRDTDNDGIEDRPVEVLTRIKDVETGLIDVDTGDQLDERETFWVVFSARDLDPRVGFNDIILRAGDQLNLAFVQDRDRDGVWAREEYLHGSSDRRSDTDSDGLSDREEIQDGWLVRIRGAGESEPVYPNPVQADSDRDGLIDLLEYACGLDPRRRDTDKDGLTDYEELHGVIDNGGSIVPMVIRDRFTGELISVVPQYSTEAILDGGNGLADSTPQGDDVAEPLSEAGGVVISAGPDGFIESIPSGDDFLAASHEPFGDCNDAAGIVGFATDPLNDDSDGDAIVDGSELALGINPNDLSDGPLFLDDDRDGVANLIEDEGFDAVVNGEVIHVNSSNANSDSDADGLPDLLEYMLGSNPQSRDTDADGLLDSAEYRNGATCITNLRSSDDPCIMFEEKFFDNYQDFLQQCAAADTCYVDAAEFADHPGTNLNERDSDYDDVEDPDELDSRVIAVDGVLVTLPAPVSDPLLANSDGDTLSDGDELIFGTDPRNADTDDDGTLDSVELTIGTNPLSPDQLVTFRFSSISVIGCEDGNGSNPEIVGSWRITLQGQPTDTVVRATGNSVSYGTDLVDYYNARPAERTFLLTPDQSVVVDSAGCYEEDTPPWDDHEDISEISEVFGAGALGVGFPLSSESKTYNQTGGGETCLSTQLAIIVAQSGEPVFAIGDSETIDEDVDITINVITNDLLGAPPTTITSVSQPENGFASVSDVNSSILYSPYADFNGRDTFSYTITDSAGFRSSAIVLIIVRPVNDGPPIAVDDPDAATTMQNVPVDTANVLANDTLVDRAAITDFDSTSNAGGTVSLNEEGATFHYVPPASFIGTDTFSYTITDDEGESDSATVTITVNN